MPKPSQKHIDILTDALGESTVAEWLTNCIANPNKISANLCRASDILINSFRWDKSNEDESYWRYIHEELRITEALTRDK